MTGRGLRNFEVLNTHPALLPLPIRRPSLFTLPKLRYPSEGPVALIDLLLQVVHQHLLQELQLEVSEAQPILLVDLSIRVKPPLTTFKIHVVGCNHSHGQSVEEWGMPILPCRVPNLGIVNAIIIPKVSLPSLVLLDAPMPLVGLLTL